MTQSAARFHVTGQVQGVGFRAATQREAAKLGLTGWVRNCTDGTVEGLAQGSAEALNALQQWLHHGPPRAAVQSLDWQVASPAETLAHFEIRR